MKNSKIEFSYKILLLGNNLVGKSSILIKYSDGFFPDNYIATVGIDYKLKHFELANGKKVKVQIWDTAGQDRYKSLTKNYYKNSNGIILVYSVVDKKSFDEISNWIEDIREETKDDIIIFLVGNKIDLNDKRVISINDAKKLAENYNIKYYETSAKTGNGIDILFNDLITHIYETNSKNIIKNDNDDVQNKKGIFSTFKFNQSKKKNDKDYIKNKKQKCC